MLDEPLSNLDAKLRHELRAEIKRLQKEIGVTTIFVTHDQEEALSMSDRVVVMNAGKLNKSVLRLRYTIIRRQSSSFNSSGNRIVLKGMCLLSISGKLQSRSVLISLMSTQITSWEMKVI